jgi:hypothetical protein
VSADVLSPEYHEAHLAFAAARIVEAAANREPILKLLRRYREDVVEAERDRLRGEGWSDEQIAAIAEQLGTPTAQRRNDVRHVLAVANAVPRP